MYTAWFIVWRCMFTNKNLSTQQPFTIERKHSVFMQGECMEYMYVKFSHIAQTCKIEIDHIIYGCIVVKWVAGFQHLGGQQKMSPLSGQDFSARSQGSTTSFSSRTASASPLQLKRKINRYNFHTFQCTLIELLEFCLV